MLFFFLNQVVARDDDQGGNSQLSYMLSGGNDEGAFSLSSRGQLSLTQTLDREAQGKYILLITAADSGTAEVWRRDRQLVENCSDGLFRVQCDSVPGLAVSRFSV